MYSIRATYIPREDMHFDRDYYIEHHIPLAQKQLAGHVRYLQMHAEFDMHVLMEEEDLRSPCVFVLSVETKEDVEAFREFRRGSEVVPLREDIEKYTDCRVTMFSNLDMVSPMPLTDRSHFYCLAVPPVCQHYPCKVIPVMEEKLYSSHINPQLLN